MPTPARFRFASRFTLLCLQTPLFAAYTFAQPSPPAVISAPAPVTVPELHSRYPLGDVAAPVQIVVFADFQCGDCKLLDTLLRELASRRKDIVITMRHFPLCADCNSAVATTIHPDACKAAIAAEAAGNLGGPIAFWRMNDWLFAVGGKFNEKDLHAQVLMLGFDIAAFTKTMNRNDISNNITNDIQFALRIGLHTTPMILVNGQEVQNWKGPGAIDQACDSAVIDKAAGRLHALLTPVARWTKEWEQQTPNPAAATHAYRWTGAAKDMAKVEIVLFGDYQERGTAQADSWLRAIVKARTDTRYTFRHFPADPTCNPAVPKKLHPLACRFAKTVEAMSLSGGDEAYWKTHDRIFQGLLNGKGQDFTDANLRELCEEFKLDYAKVQADRASAAVLDALKNDIDMGVKVGISELPAIFINGKRVGRYRGPGADDDSTLRAIVESASKP